MPVFLSAFGSRSAAACNSSVLNPAASCSQVPTTLAVCIKPASSRQQLLQAAQLRAEAYFETRSSGRFISSFKRQYVDLELRALLRRTEGPLPTCITLLATAGEEAVATLDIRPPGWADQGPVLCIPEADSSGALLSNVVVAAAQRRRGLGRRLLTAAKQVAQAQCCSRRLWAWVEAENVAAVRLYKHSGFAAVSRQQGLDPGLSIGKRLLLCCHLEEGADDEFSFLSNELQLALSDTVCNYTALAATD